MSGGGFDLGDYVDVATRIAVAREHYPEGSLQPVDPTQPFDIRHIGDDVWIVYTAAFFRWPDDPRPGIGVAWERYPGRTSYTAGSEVQNAETSAWGRAIVAGLAADTRSGVASSEEVRAAREERDPLLGPRARALITESIDRLPEENREKLRAEWKAAIQTGKLNGLSTLRLSEYEDVLEMIDRHRTAAATDVAAIAGNAPIGTIPTGALVDHGAVGHRAVERTADPTLEERLAEEERLEAEAGNAQPAAEVEPEPAAEVETSRRKYAAKRKVTAEPVDEPVTAGEAAAVLVSELGPCKVCGLPITEPNDECAGGEHAF